jgi:hypothetical protein
LIFVKWPKSEKLPQFSNRFPQEFLYSFVPTPPKALRGRLDTKESKNQAPTAVGVVGGFFIDAAPFEWSIKLIACNYRSGRYQMLPQRR